MPNGTQTTSQVTYNLRDFSIANVDEIYITSPTFYTLNDSRYPFNFYDGSRYEVQVTPSVLKIVMEYLPIASSRCVITLEYTKTTD